MEIPAYGLSNRVEDNLIMACAASVVMEDRRLALRRLANECRDWTFVVEACRAHGVGSLVCFTLETHAPDLVPRKIREIMQARFQANARRNLLLTQELLSLIQEFRQNGIKVIPFKGPLLAITAYGNVALREFLDLDILVQKKDFHHARELLVARGCRQPAAQIGQPTEEYFKSQLGCDYIRADGLVALELHWSFVQKWLGFCVDLDTIWATSQPVKVGKEEVLNLPTDITLLYLCAHGAKHRWSRLCWVVDVAEILRARPELNWEKILALARNSGCQRTLFIGLHLAKTLLKVSIPESVWAKISQDKLAVSLARTLGEQMFAPGNNSARKWSGWDKDWFHIRTKERWREKFVYLGQLALWVFQPSDKDRRWIHLPQWLNWLYVFLRPIRVAWQSLPAVAMQ
jgi:Uncharacterised nucleotidyltransferase